MADLASLSAVTRYIQADSDDDDSTIADLIRYASAMIRTFTGRSFTTPPVTEQRPIYFRGRSSVRLDDKLTAVTQIVGPYPFDRVLTSGEYELQQFPALTQLIVDRAAEGTALVTGTWGWSTVPGDIEYATVITVDEWYRGNVIPSVGGRSEGEAESANIYLPEEVQQVLAPWRPAMLIA